MAEDAITLITRDHREMERLFEQLKTQKDDRPRLVEQVGAMLLAHSRAEEEKVYPEIVASSPDEQDEVYHGAQEHAEAEQILHRLERADPQSAQFDEILTEFVEAVSHHVEEEESEILPALADAVGQAKLEELGRAFWERREQELTLRAEGAGSSATSGSAGEDPGDLTKDELYQRARDADVPGRSSMDKDELAEAVRKQAT